MIEVTLERPWLMARLPRVMRCLSWAPVGGGSVMADRVLWREVRNTDLTPELNAEDWLAGQVTCRAPGAVAMLTSRNVARWCAAEVEIEGIAAHAIVTAGLSNAEAVGRRLPYHAADWGTINLLVVLRAGLTPEAQLEAMSVAVQARTAAVIEAGIELATGRATGTGTDCVVLACDAGDLGYAGLHTAVGEAVGAAVRSAVAQAVGDWQAWLIAQRARLGR